MHLAGTIYLLLPYCYILIFANMKKITTHFGMIASMIVLATSLFSQEFNGYTLYNETNRNTTYLIDKNGDIAHTWSLERPCNYAVLLMENGNIMRGAQAVGNQIGGAAVGGMVQEIDPDGNVIWEFIYSDEMHVSHHDISLMPDGNVLLIAWEVKSLAELREMGYTGTSSQLYPTHLIEVSQKGTGGEIVWEWHIWDHMIQDTDPAKSNYGVIADHPELLDINVETSRRSGPGGGGGDWFHVNGVDYNPENDQIVFSSRFLSEIFIIDHSTTTEEAASHSGGNSGKGGDFLYRWGNPENYGVSGTRRILGPVHDARWIPDDGRPRGGYIQFFNNDGTGSRSTTDAIIPPVAQDGFNYEWTPGQPYAPDQADWRHVCLSNASGQSAANSMPNGNTFVNLSRGYMYEVDQNDNVVWQYAEGPAKAFRYTCEHPGIQVLIDSGYIENLCLRTSNLDETVVDLTIFPNPGNGRFTIGASHDILSLRAFNLLGSRLTVEKLNKNEYAISNQTEGVYIISVELENGRNVLSRLTIIK